MHSYHMNVQYCETERNVCQLIRKCMTVVTLQQTLAEQRFFVTSDRTC